MKTCLGNSLNVPAVKVEAAVGIPYITNLEIAAGITSLNRHPKRSPGPDLSTRRRSAASRSPRSSSPTAPRPSPTSGCTTTRAPSTTSSIAPRARAIFTLNPDATARRVVPENVAFIINEITSNDANRVMDFGAHGDLTLPDRRVSAKTGTAEFFLDNWTVGWTPELVSTVWVGNPDNSCLKSTDVPPWQHAIDRGNVLYSGQTVNDPFSPQDLAHYGLKPRNNACGHLDNSSGITGAAPIWHEDMRAALAGAKADWYTMPKDVVAGGQRWRQRRLLPPRHAERRRRRRWLLPTGARPAAPSPPGLPAGLPLHRHQPADPRQPTAPPAASPADRPGRCRRPADARREIQPEAR